MIYIALILMEIIFPTVLLIFDKKRSFKAALVMKTLSSLVFVAMGFYSVRDAAPGHFITLVISGLILGAIGDFLLSLRHVLHEKVSVFFIGGAVFFIGHICYLTALINDLRTNGNLLLPGILAALSVSGILIAILIRKLRVGRTLSIVGAFYMCAVTSMAVLGIFRFLTNPRDTGRLLFMIGGIFFAASDTILVENMFNPKPSFKKTVALIILYYAGQFLIAASLGL